MREEADSPRETPPAQISRREGLKLSVASNIASLLPISCAARDANHIPTSKGEHRG